ncbi:unnamed protein product [Brassicogethes aeneus]|uniref:Uncharacterized protein n=1 Tax=Brassicogethes aeneus TaxID=1431903 RepID=A0A9P0FHZ7_BRAAE|nr:unnamed protein product [Brassicogethes aeneus]
MLGTILFILFVIWVIFRITDTRNHSKACLVGKTAVVTGGNKGIGFQTSIGLAARGCKVIIACRTNAENEKNEIIKLTDNPNIIIKHLDLASFKSVRALAKDLNKTEEKIDILINNAGLAKVVDNLTEDGFQYIYQVNFLGPFLLTHLLLDSLKKAKKARILFLSSNLVWLQSLTVNTMSEKCEKVSFMYLQNAYGNTKAALAIVARVMAEKLKSHSIKCNALHPGYCYTEIFEATSNVVPTFVVKAFYLFSKIYAKTAEAGAQLTLKLAMSKSYENLSGALLWDLHTLPSPGIVRDKRFGNEFWSETEKLVGLKDSEKIK